MIVKIEFENAGVEPSAMLFGSVSGAPWMVSLFNYLSQAVAVVDRKIVARAVGRPLSVSVCKTEWPAYGAVSGYAREAEFQAMLDYDSLDDIHPVENPRQYSEMKFRASKSVTEEARKVFLEFFGNVLIDDDELSAISSPSSNVKKKAKPEDQEPEDTETKTGEDGEDDVPKTEADTE